MKSRHPLDYEPCGDCGYDHSYEPEEAHKAHDLSKAKTFDRETIEGTTIYGEKVRIAVARVTGEAPCTGEAHSNPYIDNCEFCAPKWGKMKVFETFGPAVCEEGLAVLVNDADDMDTFESLVHARKLRTISVDFKMKGGVCNAVAWIKA